MYKNKIAVTLAVIGLSCGNHAAANVATVNISNPSFETNWDGWSDTDPSAISSEAYDGNKSAKISGSSGKVVQTVTVEKNTDYTISAFVKGSGEVGVIVGSSIYSNTGGNDSWQQVSVNFNSGSNASVTIYASYNGGEGRFDLFQLTSTTSSTPSPVPAEGDTLTCTTVDDLLINSAEDDGTNDGHSPINTIDSDLADTSRWSSNGSGKWITYDLGQLSSVQELQAVWFKGNTRSSFFDVDTSTDNSNWTSVFTGGQTSGTSSGFETYDLIDSEAQYVRVTGYGNSSNTWNSIIETNIIGCNDNAANPMPTPTPIPTPGDLDPTLTPSGNFDLLDWTLGVPIDTDNNGKSDTIKENELSNGYEHNEYFYTASDGGMVFKAPIDAPKTSTNTSYTRSELREMLRRGDTSISTQGVNGNNWVFSSYNTSDKSSAAGIDGVLTATLKVDHVTTTGDSGQVGRVIVGQIHAKDDEPARLYYRLLPGHSKGSIYLAHEPNGGSDTYFEMIGSKSSSAAEPSNGITLGEVFSYSIAVSGNTLRVTIMRDGQSDVIQEVDMSNSSYHTGSDQYMYFKAGVYNQNNTGSADDYVQATFYSLSNTHTGYSF